MVPVAPEKEPSRVAPAELTSSVPPVTTVDVACGVGGVQLVWIILMSSIPTAKFVANVIVVELFAPVTWKV